MFTTCTANVNFDERTAEFIVELHSHGINPPVPQDSRFIVENAKVSLDERGIVVCRVKASFPEPPKETSSDSDDSGNA